MGYEGKGGKKRRGLVRLFIYLYSRRVASLSVHLSSTDNGRQKVAKNLWNVVNGPSWKLWFAIPTL